MIQKLPHELTAEERTAHRATFIEAFEQQPVPCRHMVCTMCCGMMFMPNEPIPYFERLCQDCGTRVLPRMKTIRFLKKRELRIKIAGDLDQYSDKERALYRAVVASYFNCNQMAFEDTSQTFYGPAWMPSAEQMREGVVANLYQLFPELLVAASVLDQPGTTNVLEVNTNGFIEHLQAQQKEDIAQLSQK